MPQTAAGNLGTALGTLLFGAPDDGGKAYSEGQAAGALVSDRMASARKARADAMIGEDRLSARQGITPQALVDAGYMDSQAPLLGNLLRANETVDLDKLGPLAAPTAGAALADAGAAMRGGNTSLGNALLALAGGKPIETTKLTDGQAFNPYGDSGQTVHLTALGDATVGEKRASAADKYASAGEHKAHAALYDKQTEVGGFNPHTGGGDAPPLPAIDPNAPKGDAYLASLDPTIAAQVKALDEGRQAFPTGTALKSPYWQAMLQHVAQYDPEFDAVNYNARAGTRKGFTSGKEAQTINSLNTVAEHLGTFSDYAESLGNFSSLGPLTHLANKLKNGYLEHSGDPRIAQFNTAKKAVADEVAKVWRASGGSQADIEENLHNLDGAQSPEQLNAAIGTLTKLIAGKIAALHDQYRSGMGRAADQKDFVSPEARDAFERTLKRGGYDVGAFESTTGAPAALGDAVTGRGAPAGRATYTQGQVITVQGKQYRVIGGDPNDPDLEPL